MASPLRSHRSSRRRAGSVIGQLPPLAERLPALPWEISRDCSQSLGPPKDEHSSGGEVVRTVAAHPVGSRRRRSAESRSSPPPESSGLPWATGDKAPESGREKGAVRQRLSDESELETLGQQPPRASGPPMPWESPATAPSSLRTSGRRLSADCPKPWMNYATESIRTTMLATKSAPPTSPWQSSLDQDVASRVFGLLTGADAAAARTVCLSWRQRLTATRSHLSPKTLAPAEPLPQGWASRFTALHSLDLSRVGDGARSTSSSCHGLARELSQLTVLRELRLPLGCRDRDLADCAEAVASRIEVLDLSYCEHLTDAGLQAWLREGVPNLRVVKLERCPGMSDSAVAALARASPKLTSLNVSNCGSVTDRGLQAMSRLGQLDHLDLSGCAAVTDSGVEALSSGNASLRSLVLYGCSQITDCGVSRLGNLKHLSSLNICGCEQVTDHGLDALRDLSGLHSIDASFCPEITGRGLEGLQQHAALTSLNLSYCKFGDSEAGLLKPFTELSTLHLRGCDLLSCTGAAEIGQVTSLRDLSLADCTRVKDRGCSGLAACTRLESLSLSGCARLSDAGLVPGLSQMSRLKWLHLAGCNQLTDDSMSALSSLPEVSYLNLTGCMSLTDQGIQALGQLACLETLVLRGCHNVSDGGIAALQSLRGLHMLSLKGCTRVTSEGIRSFIEASASDTCHVA